MQVKLQASGRHAVSSIQLSDKPLASCAVLMHADKAASHLEY
jgi:hypothetical protein